MTLDDVLHFLVARTCTPSSFGAQLDRLRLGFQPTPDPFRARADAEDRMLAEAVVIRCVDTFSSKQEFAKTSNYNVLQKIQGKCSKRQGEIAVNILRQYQERGHQSTERALVAVYQYLSSIVPILAPPDNDSDLLQSFRTGTAKRARNLACEAYADSLLALTQHVKAFNKANK
jgi:hypothetical protein